MIKMALEEVEEIITFERPSASTSKKLIEEVERLRFLVTQGRHELFKKKLITFEEVRNWNV